MTADPDRLAGLDEVRCLSLSRDATALRLRVVFRAPEMAPIAELVTDELWKFAKARS
ncbi:hypothetical protein [Gordonia jinghuaiqii]|uniref:hypothetical protein n=1 Tax=Gordonia jinghuaiqii TaxID=2758710 RepID=UPI001FD4059A|nr:hypothetical protein [Gordonia jinghuaiqii]